MGMKQRRCDFCRKRRPFRGFSQSKDLQDAWEETPDGKRKCYWCIKRGEAVTDPCKPEGEVVD